MKNLTLIGVFLLAFGASALVVGSLTVTETRPVLKAGPVEITAREERHISIPVVAGVIVMLAGAGLIIFGRRTT